MRPTELRWAYIRVGLFVALALFVGFAVIAALGIAGSPFVKRASLEGMFDDVSGLAVGSPVEMGGVVVGQVSGISLIDLKTGKVPMALAIDESALDRVGKSSFAFTSSHALVGQRFVGLTPRKPGEPHLKSGDEIRTEPSVTTAAMIEEAQRTLQQLDGLIADLRGATAALSRAGAALDRGQGTLGKLIYDPQLYDQALSATQAADEMMERAQNGDGPLATLISDRKMARSLKEGARALAGTLRRIDRGEGVLGRLAANRKDQERFDRVLANLESVSGQLAHAKGTLGGLINNRQLLARVNSLVAQMSSLVADLRRNPGRYLKIAPF